MNAIDRPVKVAFLTMWDPLDPHAWSGTMKFMFSALRSHGMEVTALGPVGSWTRMALRGANLLPRAVLRKNYDYRHSLLVAKEYAYRFGRKLTAGEFDVIFAPAASTEISLLKTDVPIVYLSDIMFADYLDYYRHASNLFRFSALEADNIERLALKNATAMICPTDWVARRAAGTYGLPRERIHVLPFGANLEKVPSGEKAESKQVDEVCRLLLLGVNWDSKGGPMALEVLKLLLEAGVPAHLTVCGCVPPPGVSHPNLTVIPFLSKRDPVQAEKLVQLLETSTFLILPTKFEAFGIVFCEASAFGLPSIARDTGGISGVVVNGVNGYRIGSTEGAEAYAKVILDLFCDPDRYHALCVSARQEYEQRLNWDSWGRGAVSVLEAVARGKQGRKEGESVQLQNG